MIWKLGRLLWRPQLHCILIVHIVISPSSYWSVTAGVVWRLDSRIISASLGIIFTWFDQSYLNGRRENWTHTRYFYRFASIERTAKITGDDQSAFEDALWWHPFWVVGIFDLNWSMFDVAITPTRSDSKSQVILLIIVVLHSAEINLQRRWLISVYPIL